MLDAGHMPEIFVLERIAGADSWEEVERRQISVWREPVGIEFPYVHPPQTPKSNPTILNSTDLTSMRPGGRINT